MCVSYYTCMCVNHTNTDSILRVLGLIFVCIHVRYSYTIAARVHAGQIGYTCTFVHETIISHSTV